MSVAETLTPDCCDARIYLPPDLLFAQRLAAGARMAVGVAAAGTAGPAPQRLVELFEQRFDLLGDSSQPANDANLGSYVVLASAWPMPALSKGAAALSVALRDALARPAPATSLLLYAAPDEDGGSNSSISTVTGRVQLEVCWQGMAAGRRAAVLPQETPAAATAGSSTLCRTPGSSAVPPSPAMQAGGRTPVLSPAMRGSGASPVNLPGLKSSGSSSTGGKVAKKCGGLGGTARGSATQEPPAIPSMPSTPSTSSLLQQRPAAVDELLSQMIAALDGGGGTSSSDGSGRGGSSSGDASRLRELVKDLARRQLVGCKLLPGNLVALRLGGQALLLRVASVDGAGPVTLDWEVRLPGTGAGDAPPAQQSIVERAAAAAAAVDGGSSTVEPDGTGAGPAAAAAARAATAGQAALAAAREVGGYQAQQEALQQLVCLPLRSPGLFAQYGMAAPTGILLHGPPGERLLGGQSGCGTGRNWGCACGSKANPDGHRA